MSDEIDLAKAVPDGAAQVVNHFMRDIEECKLDYERPCEKWAAELYEVQEQLEILKAREARLKAVVKNFKDRGVFIHGGYSLKITERAGSKTLDKDALIARLEAELGADEAKVYVQAATKVGKPSVVISVEKIAKSSGDLSGGTAGESGL